MHLSVINRLLGMFNRLGYGDVIAFTGGVARNPGIVAMLQEQTILHVRLLIPAMPYIVGALGAAIHAGRQ